MKCDFSAFTCMARILNALVATEDVKIDMNNFRSIELSTSIYTAKEDFFLNFHLFVSIERKLCYLLCWPLFTPHKVGIGLFKFCPAT